MFGDHEESMYNRMNININNPMKLGSLRLGMFLENEYIKYTDNKIGLCCLKNGTLQVQFLKSF